MEWKCASCKSQCLREMEDSICIFVEGLGDFEFLQKEALCYLLKEGKLPTLRFCIPTGHYLVVEQVGPVFEDKLGTPSRSMVAFRKNRVWGFYDYCKNKIAIKPQYADFCFFWPVGRFSPKGFALVPLSSEGCWVFINRQGQWEKDSRFRHVCLREAGLDPGPGFYLGGEFLGLCVQRDSGYGFVDYDGQELVPCQYSKAIRLVRVGIDWYFVPWEEKSRPDWAEAIPLNKPLRQKLRHWQWKRYYVDGFWESTIHFLDDSGLFQRCSLTPADDGVPGCCEKQGYLKAVLNPNVGEAILRCTWLENQKETVYHREKEGEE